MSVKVYLSSLKRSVHCMGVPACDTSWHGSWAIKLTRVCLSVNEQYLGKMNSSGASEVEGRSIMFLSNQRNCYCILKIECHNFCSLWSFFEVCWDWWELLYLSHCLLHCHNSTHSSFIISTTEKTQLLSHREFYQLIIQYLEVFQSEQTEH